MSENDQKRLTIRDLGIASSSVDGFLRRFNHPFLVFSSQKSDDDERGYFTNVVRISDLRKSAGEVNESEFTSDSMVFAVKKRPGANPYSDMITFGRVSNCDVILPFSDVSKFHGYFAADPRRDGAYVLVDVGSSNGTTLNGEEMEAKKNFPVDTGDLIVLGHSIRLLFYLPRDLWEQGKKV